MKIRLPWIVWSYMMRPGTWSIPGISTTVKSPGSRATRAKTAGAPAWKSGTGTARYSATITAATAAVRSRRAEGRRTRVSQVVQPAARSTASASTTRIEKREGARMCWSTGTCGRSAKGSGKPRSRPATRSDGPRLRTKAHADRAQARPARRPHPRRVEQGEEREEDQVAEVGVAAGGGGRSREERETGADRSRVHEGEEGERVERQPLRAQQVVMAGEAG